MDNPSENRLQICEIHGEFRSRLHAKSGKWTRCWACIEAELLALDAQAQQDDARRHRQAVTERRMAESGLEGRMLRAGFDTFVAQIDSQRAVLEACQAFAESVGLEDSRNLWIIGQPGTGKTHLGSAMVRHFIHERDTAAAIFSAREIVRMLRASWGSRGEGAEEAEGDVIERLGRAGLLVLDEVGVGFSTDAERVQLFDVIDLRYKLGRPTVVLSNLKASDMKPILGDRTYDRLREGAKQLVCNWPGSRAEECS
ncbi:ATP-binding protein [Pantoea sp. 18069]|uniref:ATP-binding protein n=1 Tax=Pantoea sp. 18069 TaxID=2681415 RepID=UPI001F419D05|nr:ATP-binding protein [Pantoea sp. 18069]